MPQGTISTGVALQVGSKRAGAIIQRRAGLGFNILWKLTWWFVA